MRLVYECPCCNKEFTRSEKGLTGSSTPVKCPHCGEVSLVQWKRLVTEDNASTLSKQVECFFFVFPVFVPLVGVEDRNPKTKNRLTIF